MELDQMIKLIKAVSDSNLTEFKMETEGMKLCLKAEKAPVMMTAAPIQSVQPQSSTVVSIQASEAEQTLSGKIVSSPLVGTFYSAPSPEAEPFVQVGDRVHKGQVLGVVEAMKLMNEIECEFDGTVKEILIENEGLVEYGQPLFVIE